MTLKSAFGAILLTSLAAAGVGAGIGGCVGWLAPDYYRLVFPQPDNANLNPLEVGVGLGTTQGLIAGTLLSVLGVGLVAWREQRGGLTSSPQASSSSPSVCGTLRIHLVWAAVTFIVTGLATVLAFIIGGIIAQEQLYRRLSDRRFDKLSTILDAPEYADIAGERGSAGMVYLSGSLNETAALETLRQRLTNNFGTEEAEEMLSGIDIISP